MGIKQGFKYKKAIQCLNFFALNSNEENNCFNKMKAIKLVWLSDRLHLRLYGRLITGDTYFALKNGPIPSATKDILNSAVDFIEESDSVIRYSNEYISNVDKYNFRSSHELDKDVFSDTDLKCLNAVNDKFRTKKPFELSDFSHLFPEWRKFESLLKISSSSRYQIDVSDFFKNLEEESGLFNDMDEEDLEISQFVFEENNKALSCLW